MGIAEADEAVTVVQVCEFESEGELQHAIPALLTGAVRNSTPGTALRGRRRRGVLATSLVRLK